MTAEEKLAIQDVIDNVRADLKAAPAAIADTASVLGVRAAVSIFYRLPQWLMVAAICGSWAAAVSIRAVRSRRGRSALRQAHDDEGVTAQDSVPKR